MSRAVSRLIQSVKPFQIIAARSLATKPVRIPAKMEMMFADESLIIKPKRQTASTLTNTTLKLLKTQAKTGCEDSIKTLTALANFDGVLCLNSGLTSEESILICSDVIAYILNHKISSDPEIRPFAREYGSNLIKIFTPHTDYPRLESKEKVSLVAVVVLLAQGLVRTYTMSLESILEKFPSEFLYALSLPIYDDKAKKGGSPIIYRTKDNQLNISFDFDNYPIKGAAESFGVSRERAVIAVEAQKQSLWIFIKKVN